MPYAKKTPAAAKPALRKTPMPPARPKPTAKSEEKILPETTSDNPITAEMPSPPSDAEVAHMEAQESTRRPKMKTAMVMDQETGRYVKQSVPVEVLMEPSDHFAHDPMGLGPDWDNGRGKEMHAHWGNCNPKYRTVEAQRKYRPVDPGELPRELRDRFMVAEVDGYDGPCVVYGDAVLLEVPKWLKEHRDARRAKLEKERNEELWGFGSQVDNLNERSRSGNWNAEFGANVSSQAGGHIDDMPDPRASLHGTAGHGDEMNRALAEAEIEAEYESRSGSRTFGGFAGNPQYNRTTWSRDARAVAEV